MMLYSTLQSRALEHADKPFMIFEDIGISWAAAVDTISRLATLLSHAGIRPGDRVLLAAGNSPTFVFGWFALRWLGATCVPLHTGATSDSLAAMVVDAGIEHAVGDASLQGQVAAAVPHLKDAFLTFNDHQELKRSVSDLPPLPPHAAVPSDECSVLYTSGTTGPPKGVILSEESFLAGGLRLAEALEVDSDDVIMLALPLFHTNPQVYGVMVAVQTGCSVVILPQFVPAKFLEEAERCGATGFTYVGTLLHLVLAKSPDIRPARLRFCVGGGAPKPLWEEVERRLNVRVHELYGMTETGGWLTATRTGDRRTGTCGVVRPDMELSILGADDSAVPTGVVGEIAVRPLLPNVLFDGYHSRPELTLEKFRNLWFHTGDLGSVDSDGFLSFHGRADDQIRRGGENLQPAEIEAVISLHPRISEVAVVGVPDEVMGQEIKFVLVPDPDSAPCLSELEDYWQERLPRTAWPRYLELRTSLPKTPTQKIKSNELRGLDGDVLDLRSRMREDV